MVDFWGNSRILKEISVFVDVDCLHFDFLGVWSHDGVLGDMRNGRNSEEGVLQSDILHFNVDIRH